MRKLLVRLARKLVDRFDPAPEPVGVPEPVFSGHPKIVPTPKYKPDRVSSGILPLPTGTFDSGPHVSDSGHLNELYNNSDNPGFLPSGHFYVYLDGQALTVCRDYKIDDEPGLYLSSWNRYNARVHTNA